MFGQELNPESYAICKADMLIKGQDIGNIIFGNTLSADGLPASKFDYMLSNPPFGVEWKKIEKEVRKEAEEQGFNGRFGPGLPRVSDGSLLFLLHLISKMRRRRTAAAASASCSTARRCSPAARGRARARSAATCWRTTWSRPSSACPRTCSTTPGISTYVWIVSNRKPAARRKGKVQLIDASSFWQKMRKSLGSKRKELSPSTSRTSPPVRQLRRGHARWRAHQPHLQERGVRLPHHHGRAPERDAKGKVVLGDEGQGQGQARARREPARHRERAAQPRTWNTYFKREVLPHAPDAWIDHEKTKVGYEIPFNRHFYVFKPPRAAREIDAELKGVTDRILTMIGGCRSDSDEKFEELASFETFPGDLLITTRGTIGRAAILPENAERGILHPCLLRLQPDNSTVNTQFLKTLIQDSDLMKTQLSYLSNATTIEVIYSYTIASVIIPVPPLNEQESIMQFITDQSAKFDTLTTEAQRAIDLLQERRTALISAAVTGQIDVRVKA
jgi:hypothetical protein